MEAPSSNLDGGTISHRDVMVTTCVGGLRAHLVFFGRNLLSGTLGKMVFKRRGGGGYYQTGGHGTHVGLKTGGHGTHGGLQTGGHGTHVGLHTGGHGTHIDIKARQRMEWVTSVPPSRQDKGRGHRTSHLSHVGLQQGVMGSSQKLQDRMDG